ncbi:MAG: sensor histidine kinase [Oligoflexales bacterium]
MELTNFIILNYCFIGEIIVFAMLKQNNSITKTVKIKQDLWEAKQLAQQWYILGNIAHDIRSPLSLSIDHFERLAEYIGTHCKPNNEIQTITEHGSKALLRINKIIHEYLTMLEEDDSNYENVNLDIVIREALMLCETKAALINKLDIRVKIGEDLEIKGQENQLVMMFVNLINNAFDALKDQQDPFIEIDTNLKGTLLIIKICDNGEGIAKENKELIFKKGFSTKRQGTGLGLDFIKLVVKNHHGRVFIDEKNPNTCFVLEFNLF